METSADDVHKLSNTGDNDTGVFDAVVDSSQQQIICEVCDEKFDQICTLKQHMFVHDGQTTADYDDCGMQSLEAHSKRRFSCKVCSKQFTRLAHLKSHMRVHTGLSLIHI